jgi:predicted Zn finger-like uncharacterized protein
MYTECPSCSKKHPITVKKLRVSHGEFLCDRCYTTFNPVDLLNERSFFKKNEGIKSESELETSEDILSGYWKYGVTSCVLILLLQVYLFEGNALAQNKVVRPWLQKICSIVNYPLAPYKNSDEFSILGVSFDPASEGTYVLKASLLNQADFSQNQPSIKLALMDFVGETFAERIFHAKDYSKNTITQINPDMTTEIKIIIAAPSNKIAGYHFELL